MPRIKSLLNGEIQNVRGDIAREMIKLGVAEAIDPVEDQIPPRKVAADVTVDGDGTVHQIGGDSYRLPKPGDAARAAQPQFEVIVANEYKSTQKFLAIRMTQGRTVVDYVGKPENANRRVTWEGGGRWLNGFGREIPAETVKEYARAYKANDNLRVAIPPPGPCDVNVTQAQELEMREGRKR
jgi:hypothetical protein